jgi:LPPG:FO 2-phospho-L-lactate transferase
MDTSQSKDQHKTVLALCGGIGGAKLALGLYHVLAPHTLSLVINTGDDMEHLGLHISPDIDTVTYTLADKNNKITHWGRQDETWNFMEALGELGGETWFSLGDKDLALHIERARRLGDGETLSNITADIAAAFDISADLMPMSNDPVRTMVETTEGTLEFQDYFVRRQCEPPVQRIYFDGSETALPSPGLIEKFKRADLRAVIICPSNPFLSVDPILAVVGIRDALNACAAPVIAISPLIGGKAVKGPTAKIMNELSIPSTARAIADYYEGLIDAYVIDHADADSAADMPVPTCITKTMMETLEDRKSLALETLAFADRLTLQNSATISSSTEQAQG